MTKEKYEKPIMEVVDLKDDVTLTSGGDGSSSYCSYDSGGCTTHNACYDKCLLEESDTLCPNVGGL